MRAELEPEQELRAELEPEPKLRAGRQRSSVFYWRPPLPVSASFPYLPFRLRPSVKLRAAAGGDFRAGEES